MMMLECESYGNARQCLRHMHNRTYCIRTETLTLFAWGLQYVDTSFACQSRLI
jgi:hypothetical protein